MGPVAEAFFAPGTPAGNPSSPNCKLAQRQLKNRRYGAFR